MDNLFARVSAGEGEPFLSHRAPDTRRFSQPCAEMKAMSEKFRDDEGNTYRLKDDGTLEKANEHSGGWLRALVDSGESVVRSAVNAVTPSGSKK